MIHGDPSEAQEARIKELEALVLKLEGEVATTNADLLLEREKVKALNTQVLDAQYVLMEITGTLQEYLNMPCDSLRSRMFATLDRYRPRIDEHRRLYRAFEANADVLPRLATQANYEQIRAVLKEIVSEALDEAESMVHVCDKDDDLVKLQRVSPNIKLLYFLLPY